MTAVIDMENAADECARWAARAPLTEGVLTPFGVLDPTALSQDGRLDLLVGLERLINWCHAQQARVMAAAAADPDPVPCSHAGERSREHYARMSLRHEIAAALHWSPDIAETRMMQASALVDRLPATLASLENGSVSPTHARTLLEAVRELDENATGKVEAAVLARAGQQTPAEFRRTVRTVAARLDPRREAEQHEAAASERRVCYQPDQNAMAWINAYLPAADARTVMTAVQAVADKNRDANRQAGPGDRCADHRRADALTSICAGILTGATPDGTTQWQGRRPTVQVSVALSTLTGHDDQPGQLDGYGPVPADYARLIASDPTGTWRRLVTDPAGSLLDYGRSTYRPPANLRDHVIARDRTCRGLGCHRNSRRAELDHVHPWIDGGATAAGNLASECSREQHLKHDAGWKIRLAANGTVTWTSPTGRRYDKPPEPYPVDTTSTDADPPPF